VSTPPELPGRGRPVGRSDKQTAWGILVAWTVAVIWIGRHFGWW